MTDLRNLKAFALYMQKTDIKFDLYSITKEMEKQVIFSSYVCNQSIWRSFIYHVGHFKDNYATLLEKKQGKKIVCSKNYILW